MCDYFSVHIGSKVVPRYLDQIKYTLFIFALFLSLSASGAEKVKVFWDCSLEGDPVSCVDLKLAYFSADNLEEAGSLSGSDLNLIIRVLPLNNEVEYQVTTKWREGSELLFPGFRINSTLSASERLEKVLVF
jgi:hypothetical protein